MKPILLTRRQLLALAVAAGLPLAPARAGARDELYRGRTIVTGRRDETRIPGMARCLAQVLGRVSGDARLAQRPELAAFAKTPDAAVKAISYIDLYAFRPIRDEQGTRDRPYEMTVAYDPAKIDAILAGLGSRPWLAPRPGLMVFLAVHHIGSTFVLSAEAEAGQLMREAFQNAGWNAAMEVEIAPERLLGAAKLDTGSLEAASPAMLAQLLDQRSGQIPLWGVLRWRKDLLAWEAAWKIAAGGREHRWGIAGVNFDAAFRNAVSGAALILSGNGTPG